MKNTIGFSKRLFAAALAALLLVTQFSASYAGTDPNAITNDTEIYDRLHEIRVRKNKDLNFELDRVRLVAMESQYSENLRVTRQRPLRKKSAEKKSLKRIQKTRKS
jgi:hypothetical protein